MGIVSKIGEVIKRHRLFKRERVPHEVKAIAVMAYYFGQSYRKVAKLFQDYYKFSHQSLSEWYKRLSKVFPLSTERKEREAIAVDETKICVKGEWHYFWIAIDVDTREILAVHFSKNRSGLETLIFLKQVIKKCSNKPVFYVDKGPWYPWAFQRLGLTFIHETFGNRNPVEQWFSILKRRLFAFFKYFPHHSSYHSTLNWLTAFTTIYNLSLSEVRPLS